MMSKRAIWVIIGLMSAALLGICWLQVNWIRSSIRLNQEQFDKNVFAALNKVSERLEYDEQLNFYNFLNNGFVRSYMENKLMERIRDGEVTVSLSFENESYDEVKLSRQDLLTILVSEPLCDCDKCTSERVGKFAQMMKYYEGLYYTTLENRIDLEHLNEYISQELNNLGIDTEFKYGVYSRSKKSFVIGNNHFLVPDNQPQVTQEGYKNLYTSKYRANLFQPQKGQAPGLLMVFFPAKASYVWANVWRNLAAAIVFTALILFCFAYTVFVIFRQKKLSEMKTDFINNMTHEFKTPIATISLAADSISSPMVSGDSGKVMRFANIIKQENKRMNSQVEKVLQMALIDKKDFDLKLTNVNLHEVINRAVENICLQVEKRGGTAKSHLEASNPYVEADLIHISNIINNLLDNANKYSPDAPEISVHTRNVSNGVEVIVKDKGIGMSKEARKHIFDKFYRVPTGNLHDVKGFGLGLSYVKALMTAHKGQIDVKSEPGKGSSFILFFPYLVESRHSTGASA
ncbi:MAG: HAMP domain-containing histidine kinase [Saprospirales bacterium]|nr:HAMP domain-containing histidine kinase [Saprospirales bacterium]MBK8491605.1 HAMP domain-containing histidine kinase [Saprospirales bacterium]